MNNPKNIFKNQGLSMEAIRTWDSDGSNLQQFLKRSYIASPNITLRPALRYYIVIAAIIPFG